MDESEGETVERRFLVRSQNAMAILRGFADQMALHMAPRCKRILELDFRLLLQCFLGLQDNAENC